MVELKLKTTAKRLQINDYRLSFHKFIFDGFVKCNSFNLTFHMLTFLEDEIQSWITDNLDSDDFKDDNSYTLFVHLKSSSNLQGFEIDHINL